MGIFFTAVCFRNQNTVLNIVYADRRSKYRSVMAMTSFGDGYKGNWYDNAGSSGDVVFKKP